MSNLPCQEQICLEERGACWELQGCYGLLTLQHKQRASHHWRSAGELLTTTVAGSKQLPLPIVALNHHLGGRNLAAITIAPLKIL